MRLLHSPSLTKPPPICALLPLFFNSRILFQMSDISDDPGSNFVVSDNEEEESMGLVDDDVRRGWRE